MQMQKMPKALVCGLLEDKGRVLFLKRMGKDNKEAIELPCVLSFAGNYVQEISRAFFEQVNIDAHAEEIIFEARHNAGSRKKKYWIPCLVFFMNAKSMFAKQSKEFSGYKWISLKEARALKLSRNCEWLLHLKADP